MSDQSWRELLRLKIERMMLEEPGPPPVQWSNGSEDDRPYGELLAELARGPLGEALDMARKADVLDRGGILIVPSKVYGKLTGLDPERDPLCVLHFQRRGGPFFPTVHWWRCAANPNADRLLIMDPPYDVLRGLGFPAPIDRGRFAGLAGLPQVSPDWEALLELVKGEG